jgi:hypothetical protein
MYPSVILKRGHFLDICLSYRSLRCLCEHVIPSTLNEIKDAISLSPSFIDSFQHSRLSPVMEVGSGRYRIDVGQGDTSLD